MTTMQFALFLVISLVGCGLVLMGFVQIGEKVRRIFAAQRDEEARRINASWCRAYGHIFEEGTCPRCGVVVVRGVDHIAHPMHTGPVKG